MTGCLCITCKHFDTQKYEREVCTAFPSGISVDIFLNRVNHRKPLKGDHGVRWEPKAGFEWMQEIAS